jgi:hypothetical protein
MENETYLVWTVIGVAFVAVPVYLAIRYLVDRLYRNPRRYWE